VKKREAAYWLLGLLLVSLGLVMAGTVVVLVVKHMFAVDVTETVVRWIQVTLFFWAGYSLRGLDEGCEAENQEARK